MLLKRPTASVFKLCTTLTFAIAVCECWNVSDKYVWDNAADLRLVLTLYRIVEWNVVESMPDRASLETRSATPEENSAPERSSAPLRC